MVNNNFNNSEHFLVLQDNKQSIQLPYPIYQKIIRLNGLQDIIKSALSIETKEIQTITNKKWFHFYLKKIGEDLLLRLKITVNSTDSANSQNLRTLSKLQILDFKGAKVLFKNLHTEEEFFSYLKQINQLRPQEKIPSSLFFGNTAIKLSRELIMGLKKERNTDHFLSLSLLERCLKKKIKRLKREKKEKIFSFYFKITEKEETKFLNLVVHKYASTNELVVLTAYYVDRQSLAFRQKLNGLRLDAFINNLPYFNL